MSGKTPKKLPKQLTISTEDFQSFVRACLGDEEGYGIDDRAFGRLCMMLEKMGVEYRQITGMNVDATDGRFYIPHAES